MANYARKIGRRRHPARKKWRTVAKGDLKKELFALPDARQLVAAGVRINGEVKSAISPEILKQTEGMPWHARRARIHAITNIPFAEISRVLDGQDAN
jgi:hypothetical protein